MTSKRNNVKLVCLFGESGSGKTTTIRNTKEYINGYKVKPNTGIIRYLFEKNSYYVSPIALLNKYWTNIDELTPDERKIKSDEIYERYAKSQCQLLNDWSSEMFEAFRAQYSEKTAIVFDRSPMDFYVLTMCGLSYLKNILHEEYNDTVTRYIETIKRITKYNTDTFIDAIIVTEPWTETVNSVMNDGIRDHYLDPAYRGDNWYGKLKNIDYSVKTYSINNTVTALMQRASMVNEYLSEVCK